LLPPALGLLRRPVRFRTPVRPLSNNRTARRLAKALVCICFTLPSAVLAQAPATLEAVRLFRDDARARGEAEWAACQRASCVSQPRLSLLLGVLALAAGEAQAAKDQLRSTPPPAGLEAYHAFYSGEAAFYTRDFAEAAADFETTLKSATRALTQRATARAGEAWWAAGEAAKALPYLDKAVANTPTPELMFQRAQARAAVGHLDEARADYRTLALRHPAHPYALQAVAQLAPPKGAPLFTFNERLVRMRGLLDAGMPEAALAEVDAIQAGKLARGASAVARQALLEAEALFALGKEDQALKKLDVASKGQRSVAAEAAIYRARRMLRAGDNVAARAAMAEVDKNFPKEAPGEEGGYFAGWLDLQGGRFADAVKAFAAFEKRHPSSHRRDEALWFKSLASLRQQKYAEARKSLEALTTQFPRSSLVPQARYWAVRCDQLGGSKPPLLAPRFTEIIHQFPGSFYALLSATRLHELGVEPPTFFPDKAAGLKVEMPDALKLAVALSETGLFRDASDEVAERVWAVRSADDALQYGAALQSVGDFGAAYGLAARLLWGMAYAQKKPEALAIFYPRAFRDAVETESKGRALDAFFVWAIMRRESAFRPGVVSGANARGLLQLIPKTISGIAQALGEPEPDADALYSPQLNIHYASWYLSELFKRFSHPVLVAAAYNASPEAVVRWVDAHGDLPLDLFIEMIPFKETRGYVKQVVADYHLYGELYGAAEGQKELALTIPKPSPDGVQF
jgi:soluble lytic murein transglycosylase